MMFLLHKAMILPLLLLLSIAAAAGERDGVIGVVQPQDDGGAGALHDGSVIGANVTEEEEDPVLLVRSSPKAQRNLTAAAAAPTVERRSVLIVRVNNPRTTVAQVYRAVFTDVSRQMTSCSNGLVRIEPVASMLRRRSAISVSIPMPRGGLTRDNVNAFVALAEQAALRQLPGNLRDIHKAAHHIIFVLPHVPNYSASGEMGFPDGYDYRYGIGKTSQYSDAFAASLTLLMHELVSQ